MIQNWSYRLIGIPENEGVYFSSTRKDIFSKRNISQGVVRVEIMGLLLTHVDLLSIHDWSLRSRKI